ncbi:hypothetical protein R1sor_013588 [Riccia sorocarpa]|uniref:Uncharacterized protein n=1 Tax=Riccia sorocarpa TaxID=122646 RepID=A0ABD3HAU5_9MARC
MGTPDPRPLAEAFKGLYAKPEHIDYAVIDAFSEGAYAGNPAAVVVLPAFKDVSWMQKVAAEFNLSETCYLVKRSTKLVEGDTVTPQNESSDDSGVSTTAASSDDLQDGSQEGTVSAPEADAQAKHVIHEYDLRWFCPTYEVDLCGHATLAASFVLFETGLVGKKETIFFHTRSGLLSVRTVGPEIGDAQSSSAEGRSTPAMEMIEMNLPWTTTTPSTLSSVETLTETLKNVEVIAVGKAAHRLIVELGSKEDVENFRPNMQELMQCDSEALFVTASGGPVSGYDFVSRCFFPKWGVDEDPVCGSAHCALGPYWSTKLGKDNLLAYQASKRGGTLAIQVDKKIGRVYLRGQAVMVMAGVLLK